MNRYCVNLTKKNLLNVALISTQNVITETLTLFVIIKKMLTTDTRKISTRCSSTLKLHIDLNWVHIYMRILVYPFWLYISKSFWELSEKWHTLQAVNYEIFRDLMKIFLTKSNVCIQRTETDIFIELFLVLTVLYIIIFAKRPNLGDARVTSRFRLKCHQNSSCRSIFAFSIHY